MPRYEDSYTSRTRLYVGNLSSRTRSRDLEHIFSRFGRVRDVDMKRDYAFVELSGPRDADDARYNLDGINVDGRRISVEFSKGVPRGSAGARDHVGRGSAPGSGRCFHCGVNGHWSRDCKAGDWKNKCYRCGERGHIERKCRNSLKKLRSLHKFCKKTSYSLNHRRPQRYSRSPVRSCSPHGGQIRSQGLRRRNGRKDQHVEHEESRSRGPSGRSPEQKRVTSFSKKHNPTQDNDTGREKGSRSPSSQSLVDKACDESPYGEGHRDSPKERSRSPVYGEGLYPREGYRDSPYGEGYRESPYGEGHHDSPKERSRSPVYKSYNESPCGWGYRDSPKERSRNPMCKSCDESPHKGGYHNSPKEGSQSPVYKCRSPMYALHNESPYAADSHNPSPESMSGKSPDAVQNERTPPDSPRERSRSLICKSCDESPYKGKYRDSAKKRSRSPMYKLYDESPYEGGYRDSAKKRSRSPMYKWCDESPYAGNGSGNHSPSSVDGSCV